MATRKGVRNQLKNFLWRTKSSATETPKGSGGLDTSQGSQTPEGQLRVLADLAFLMQDYETCLAALRLLVSDLKSDREWRFYAAAQVLFCHLIKLQPIHTDWLSNESGYIQCQSSSFKTGFAVIFRQELFYASKKVLNVSATGPTSSCNLLKR